MAVLSKFFAGTLGFKILHAKCYEISHVWNPDCNMAIVDALPAGIRFCLKTYSTFYLVRGAVPYLLPVFSLVIW